MVEQVLTYAPCLDLAQSKHSNIHRRMTTISVEGPLMKDSMSIFHCPSSVPPERVTMEASDFVMQNDDAVFTCKTAVSNPKATISWFIEDEQMTSVTGNLSRGCVYNCR